MNTPTEDGQGPEAFVRLYEQLRPEYERFASKFEFLLRDLVQAKRIDYDTINSRTKSVTSFATKIQRPGKKYKNPMKEVTDLVGIRVVVFYIEDIVRISNLLKREFVIDPVNSIDKSKILEPNEFGYQSVHYVISLGKKRSKLPEWKSFKDLKAEIQVRTVLQHAWASVSRTFDYTREADIPRNLRRRLFRLAGLFEIADEEFSGNRAAHAREAKSISTSLKSGKTDIELNLDSLKEYFGRSQYFAELESIASKVGFTLRDYKHRDSYLPKIVQEGHDLNLRSIDDFAGAVQIPIHNARKYLRALLARAVTEVWSIDRYFIAELLLIRFNPELLNANYLSSQAGWTKIIAETVVLVAEKHHSGQSPS